MKPKKNPYKVAPDAVCDEVRTLFGEAELAKLTLYGRHDHRLEPDRGQLPFIVPGETRQRGGLTHKWRDRTMTNMFSKNRRALLGFAALAAFLAALSPFASAPSAAAGDDPGAQVRSIFAEKLPNVPGSSLTAVIVTYAPGDKSAKHRHAGSVFVYVLSGAVRSENSATGPAKIYRAGESFFEPAGSAHLVSENASATEPASLLAVFVADDGAQLTIFDE